MNIVIINGQNHKGSTYHIGRMLAERVGGNITEFFLPRDFSDYCVGCGQCFEVEAESCPHYEAQQPILKAMDVADLIILTSPVYVYHASAPMKNFLDHQGHRWLVHRPKAEMFTKQAVCISTAAGAGMKSTNKDMADSLFFWGCRKYTRWDLQSARSTGMASPIRRAPKLTGRSTKLHGRSGATTEIQNRGLRPKYGFMRCAWYSRSSAGARRT